MNKFFFLYAECKHLRDEIKVGKVAQEYVALRRKSCLLKFLIKYKRRSLKRAGHFEITKVVHPEWDTCTLFLCLYNADFILRSNYIQNGTIDQYSIDFHTSILQSELFNCPLDDLCSSGLKLEYEITNGQIIDDYVSDPTLRLVCTAAIFFKIITNRMLVKVVNIVPVWHRDSR